MATAERKEPEWDCIAMQEHYNILSGCCGAEEHDHVEAISGACNEFTSWFCSLCEEDVDDQIWHTWLPSLLRGVAKKLMVC